MGIGVTGTQTSDDRTWPGVLSPAVTAQRQQPPCQSAHPNLLAVRQMYRYPQTSVQGEGRCRTRIYGSVFDTGRQGTDPQGLTMAGGGPVPACLGPSGGGASLGPADTESQSWCRHALPAIWHSRARAHAQAATISFLPESEGQEDAASVPG